METPTAMYDIFSWPYPTQQVGTGKACQRARAAATAPSSLSEAGNGRASGSLCLLLSIIY